MRPRRLTLSVRPARLRLPAAGWFCDRSCGSCRIFPEPVIALVCRARTHHLRGERSGAAAPPVNSVAPAMPAAFGNSGSTHHLARMPSSDNQSTAERGRRAVSQELERRGVTTSEVRRGNLSLLEIRRPSDRQRVHLRVKTRTSGSWQGSIRDADPDPPAPHPDTYWVFVELEDPRRPGFFIVPDQWMRKDIHEAHQKYLQRHGGTRAESADSLHHSIEPKRILQWRNRWDLIGV
jgi:hypothetical protein